MILEYLEKEKGKELKKKLSPKFNCFSSGEYF